MRDASPGSSVSSPGVSRFTSSTSTSLTDGSPSEPSGTSWNSTRKNTRPRATTSPGLRTARVTCWPFTNTPLRELKVFDGPAFRLLAQARMRGRKEGAVHGHGELCLAARSRPRPLTARAASNQHLVRAGEAKSRAAAKRSFGLQCQEQERPRHQPLGLEKLQIRRRGVSGRATTFVTSGHHGFSTLAGSRAKNKAAENPWARRVRRRGIAGVTV